METKKGMGVSTLAHPRLQALALPHFKDSNADCPRQAIIIQLIAIHNCIAIAGYNLPTQAFRCIISVK